MKSVLILMAAVLLAGCQHCRDEDLCRADADQQTTDPDWGYAVRPAHVAPEIDPDGAGAGITLAVGLAALVAGRRRNRR